MNTPEHKIFGVVALDRPSSIPTPSANPDYLRPELPAGLARVVMPVVDATCVALQGYGQLINDPQDCPIEIIRWPAQGSRPVDADSGDQGATTEGVFISEWRGDILYGRNEAVDGHYILAYSQPPEFARIDHADLPKRMILWHANYHPDGGQLFFPLDRRAFCVPLALPGDAVTPQQFVCFRFDGTQGLYRSYHSVVVSCGSGDIICG
jgi:hypothetical protein